MKKTLFIISASVIFWLANFPASGQVIIPLSTDVLVDDTYTIIWNGVSLAYRFERREGDSVYEK